jgi:hypothetical protein
MRVNEEPEDQPAPIESALESDQSLSRKLAERYLGKVRRPRRTVDSSMEASVEELPREPEKPAP